MGDRTAEPLDDSRMFFLSAFNDDEGRVRSYSIDVEKAEDSHYVFTPEAMNALDGYLVSRYTGRHLWNG